MVKVAKKLFTMSVVTLTILWSVGIAALVPTTVNAVDCPELEAGDLFKVPGNTAVYLLNADMERMYFPNSEVYKTWYADYSGVVEIPTTCVDAYPAPSKAPYGVNYRPGSRLVKVQISNSVYAVGPNNTKMKIGSEEVAKALYGDKWATLVRDVADVYWPNLVNTGDEMTTTDLHDGMLVKSGTKVYSVEDGMLYEVDGDLGVATGDVRTVAASLIADKEMADDTVTPASLVENPAQTSATEGGEDNTVTSGDLSLSLAASTPDSEEIPKDVMGYTYLTLNAKAGDEDVDITALTIKRKGLGVRGDFDVVYVEVNGIRHGNKRTINTDNEAEIYFSTDASKITVPANSTVKIDIVADMSGDSGNSNYLQVTAVETTAKLDADLPISGNKMEISNQTAPSVTFDYNGDSEDVTVGETNVTVAEFAIDGDSDEDVVLNSITLKQTGTADDNDVTNYTLVYGDEELAGPVNVEGDYVIFELDDPMTIEQDESYDFEVKADIEGGNTDTVELTLDESTDLKAIGTENEFNVKVTITGASTTDYQHDITGGALSVDEHKDNPTAESYAPETEDVLMLAAELEADDETVVVTDMYFTFTGTAIADSMENLTIKLDGKTVCGPMNVVTSTHCDEEFEVKGTQKLEVFADFTAAALGDYTASLVGSTMVIENLDGDSLTAPTGSATGKNVNISNGTLTVSKDTKYTDKTITTNATKYKIGSFTIKTPATQEVRIKQYNVSVTGTAGVVAGLTDLYISEDTDVISEPELTNTFSVSQLLAKEVTKTVSVYASFDDTTGTLRTSLSVNWKGETTASTTNTSYYPGQLITVLGGTLTPTRASTNPDADIVLSEASNVKVFSVQFDANYDTYTVTDMDITMSSSTAVTALKIGDVTVTDFVNGVAEFDNLDIDVTDKTKVDVYATFNKVGEDDVSSGVITTFKLSGFKADAAEGEDYDYDDSEISDSVISEEFTLRAAKPSFSFTAGTEANTATSKDLMSVGDNELVKMTVTADGDTVNLRGLQLSWTLSGVTSGEISLVTLYDSSRQVVATSTYASSSDWTFNDGTDTNFEIGTSDYYFLGFTASPVAAGDQVAVKVTGAKWDDDYSGLITTTDITGIPSAKFVASIAN